MSIHDIPRATYERAWAGLLSPEPINRCFTDPSFAAIAGPDVGDARAMAAACLWDVRTLIWWPFQSLVEARATWHHLQEFPPNRLPDEHVPQAIAIDTHPHFASFVVFAGTLGNYYAATSFFLDGRTQEFKRDHPLPKHAAKEIRSPRLRTLLTSVVDSPEWQELLGGSGYRNRLLHCWIPRLEEMGAGRGFARKRRWQTGDDGTQSLAMLAGPDAAEYRLADLLEQGGKLWNSLVEWGHGLFDDLADQWESHPGAKNWDRPGPPVPHSDLAATPATRSK